MSVLTVAETGASASDYPPYPAYRNSGVELLDPIPEHWRIEALKYLVDVNPEALGEDTDPSYEIAYVDIGNVASGQLLADPETMAFGDAPSRARRIVRANDVIVSTVRTYLKAVARFPSPPPNLIVSTGFAVLRSTSRVADGYLYYSVLSQGFVGAVVAHSVGVSYPAINPSDLVRLPVCLPPLPEQHAIGAFLDRETAALDALAAKKRRLIALLEEKRAALIARAVTRGLDPAAPTTDSGVGWLGAVPGHWQVRRLKQVARLESGHTPSRSVPEYWFDCTIPWVSLADVGKLRGSTVDVIEDTKEMISELGMANSSARLLPAGTVILSRTASVGFSTILGRPMATTQDFVNWICGPALLPQYLLQCFRAMQPEFKRLTMGSTHQTIYMPDVERFVVPLPPLAEQEAIVDAIHERTANLDDLIAKLRETIVRLGEYRTALIAAAVTGQIDIRGNCAGPVAQDV